MVYIPETKTVIGPTVQATFDENIPNHAQAYFEELNYFTEMPESSKPEVVDDYHYLINTHHIDDEDGTEYKVNRVTNHNDYIVGYRTSILHDGSLNRWEDEIPIHIKDIVRMTTNSSNSGAPSVTGGGSRTIRSPKSIDSKGTLGTSYNMNSVPGQLVATPSSKPHLSENQTLKRKATTSLSETETLSISDSYERATTPTGRTQSSSTNSGDLTDSCELHPTRRDRQPRILLNVTRKGDITAAHVDHHTTERLPQMPSTNSTYQALHAMTENGEFPTSLVPSSYKEAMQSNDSCNWQLAIDKEIKSIADNKVFSVVDKPPNVKLQSGRFLFKIKYTGNGTVFKARLIAHGFKQVPGLDFWETYAPVSSSISTRIFLTMCATYGLSLIHISEPTRPY